MSSCFDRYAWHARILPSLITLLPVALLGLSWLPRIEDSIKPALALVVGAGTLFLVAQISRDLGKVVEQRLVAKWGEMPTTIFLRNRDCTLETVTKARYHRKLSNLMDDLAMPTLESECKNPQAADQVYVACARYLLSKTRDPKTFPLLQTENIYYGFRRNLLGLKPIGVVLAVFGAGGTFWKNWSQFTAGHPALPAAVGCFILTIALLCLWIFFINEQLVRRGADAYAIRLLETIECLAEKSNVHPGGPMAKAD